MTKIIPAEHYRLNGLGAVAPGYRANLVVFNDLKKFEADRVFYNGVMVAQEGRIAVPLNPYSDPKLSRTVNIKPFDPLALRMPAKGATAFAIQIVPGQIITRKIEVEVTVRGGFVQPDVEKDLLKLVVVERHQATGNIGRGLVRGFGLKKGAIASSVAHDAHNVIAIGADDDEIFAAIKEVERLQGGIAVAAEGRILGSLALPIAGLLSDEPLSAVVMKLEGLKGIVANLGCPLESPFTLLSFLSLPVIPELRLTDKGLVDVGRFQLSDEGGA
jgi:adenine deaminase